MLIVVTSTCSTGIVLAQLATLDLHLMCYHNLRKTYAHLFFSFLCIQLIYVGDK